MPPTPSADAEAARLSALAAADLPVLTEVVNVTVAANAAGVAEVAAAAPASPAQLSGAELEAWIKRELRPQVLRTLISMTDEFVDDLAKKIAQSRTAPPSPASDK